MGPKNNPMKLREGYPDNFYDLKRVYFHKLSDPFPNLTLPRSPKR